MDFNPHISLKIENHTPHIVYYPSEGVSRRLTTNEENLYEIVLDLATKLEIIDLTNLRGFNNEEIFTQLLYLARSSDELFVEEIPVLETNDVEFKLKAKINDLFNKVIEKSESLNLSELNFKSENISPKLKEELTRIRNSDLFASLLESLYLILIGKTVFAAAELGIGFIKLEDHTGNARLTERMSYELEKLGVEMLLD